MVLGLVAFLICSWNLDIVSGYATFYAQNCQVVLGVGKSIMGNAVVSGNTRELVIMRGAVQLLSGDVYTPGEVLSVSLSTFDVQYAFQIVSGFATFQDGFCANTRYVNNIATMIMPYSGVVELLAGSASRYGTVAVTSTFVLNAPTAEVMVPNTPTETPLALSPIFIPVTNPALAGPTSATDDQTYGQTDDVSVSSATETPSAEPSRTPSTAPSRTSSRTRTRSPSLRVSSTVPRSHSTSIPTAQSSYGVSTAPTPAPSSPSNETHSTSPPSNAPSVQATLAPSVNSSAPVTNSSFSPTIAPTNSSLPTNYPDSTAAPTTAPTAAVTATPSILPTATRVNTAPPSLEPSSAPSLSTTAAHIPSPPPTTSPTTLPSLSPTDLPITIPSARPTHTVETLVTFLAAQRLFNVSVPGSEAVEVSAVLDRVMTKCLSQGFSAPFSVSSVVLQQVQTRHLSGGSSDSDSAGDTALLQLTNVQFNIENNIMRLAEDAPPAPAPTTVVLYTVGYILESTQQVSAASLQNSLSVALGMSDFFRLTLRDELLLLQSESDLTAAIHALRYVTESELLELALTGISYLRSPVPSLVPSDKPVFTGSGGGSVTGSGGVASINGHLSHTSLQYKIIVGVAVGVGSLLLVVTVTRYYLLHYKSIRRNYSALCGTVPSYLAVLLAFGAVAQLALWARDSNSSTDGSYLGEPHWKRNLFAYHVVFMVGGFFAAQVIAVSLWNALQCCCSRRVTKVLHILLQTVALGSLGVGLYAIVEVTRNDHTPALSSIHAYMGIAAVAAFGANYALGWLMGVLTACRPSSLLRKAFDLRRIHRAIGLGALGLGVLAIVTGVNNHLPQGACYYVLPPNTSYGQDRDPAEHYSHLKTSCRLAYGMTMCVVAAAICAVLGVVLRNDQGIQDCGESSANTAAAWNVNNTRNSMDVQSPSTVRRVRLCRELHDVAVTEHKLGEVVEEEWWSECSSNAV